MLKKMREEDEEKQKRLDVICLSFLGFIWTMLNVMKFKRKTMEGEEKKEKKSDMSGSL